MNLSDKEKGQIKETVEATVRALHAAHLARDEGSLERFMSFFDEDVFAIGTGQEEVMQGKSGLRLLIEREWQEITHNVHHVIHSVHVQVLSGESASAHTFLALKMSETGDGEYIEARLSTMLQKMGADWKVIGWHASTPWDIQPEGVSWPTDELEARAKKLEKEVAARTEELSRANRELAVDAAIERIRRVTGEMNDPSDLIDVVKQIKREMDVLFKDGLAEVGLIQEADANTFRFWSIMDANEAPDDLAQFGLLYPKEPQPRHPLLDVLWRATDEYAESFFDLDAMWQIHASLAHYNPPEAEMVKTMLDSGMEGGWVSISAVQVGRLYFSWASKPPEELGSVQPRMAAVLSEAQKRVEELQTAHRMRREAEIEAAMERIRGRALAMRSSNELKDIVLEIRRQIDGLGQMNIEASVVHLYTEGAGFFRSIAAVRPPGHEGDIVTAEVTFPTDRPKVIELMMEQWHSDATEYTIELDRAMAEDWQRNMMKFAPVIADRRDGYIEETKIEGHDEWWNFADFSEGNLLLVTHSPPSEDTLTVLRKTAEVFDLAYQRYRDLEKAEAQAREAEISLAVEKVRARASGMQASNEIVDVANVLREQLIGLGLTDVMACTVYTRTPDGKHRVSEMARLEEESSEYSFDWIFDPAQLHPDIMVHDFLAAQQAKVFYEDADAMALLLKESLKIDPEYTEDYQKAIEESGISEVWIAVCPAESVRLCIDFKTEPPEEILSILPRMARAFDHAYRRHQDLERAEAQTREAQIEAALERIRSRTMAMQSSDELSEVSLLLDKEIRTLGTKTWGCAFHIYGEEDSTEWFGGEMGVRNPYKVPRDKYFLEFYEHGQAGESLFIKEFPEGECAEHYDYMKTLPGLRELLLDTELAGIELPSSQIDHVAYFKYGYLLFITLKPAPDAHDIFQRFAKVFEQSYTRFLDLEKAEEQAREAQIEAALERVRGRALAMRSSGELNEVAEELRRQMALLGQTELEVCTIHIYDRDGDDFESWGVINDPSKEGPVETEVRLFPKKGVPILEEIIAAYESEKNNHVFLNDGKKAAGFFGMLRERHPDVLERLMTLIPPGLKPDDMKAWWSFSDFRGGSIGIVTYKPADTESLELLERTAGVFDLAYRRFKDLKEAEAAQREAQIEAALERVRSRSLAMQSSDELMDVAQVLFQQLIALGMDPDTFETCGFVIFRDGTRIGDTFLTQLDGSPLAYTFSAEYGGDRATREHWDAWEQGLPITMVHLVGDELTEHLDYLTDMSGEPINRFHEMASVPVPPGSYNYSANFRHGYVAVITTEPQETAEALYPRFAKVFEQAYTRFLDLKKAEAAAREARIENALEKIRSRTMGMQTGEELKDVVVLLYKELIALGVTDFVTCGYVEINEDKQIQDTWVTSPGGDTFGLFYLPLQGDATFDARYAAWKKQEPIFHQTVAGQERSDHLEYAITKFNSKEAEEMVRSQFPDPTVFYCFNFSHGYLHIVGGSLLEKEEELLIARFTKVFEQTYTRFLDLQKAEAQARESRIEAALERVRAVATAMRNSNELLSVMQHIHKEFSGLGFPCGAFWNSRYLDTHYEKAVTGMDGSQVTAVMELPRDFSMIPELAAWERGTEKLGVFQFGTEASIEYLNHMINKGKFLEIVPDALTEELLREMGGWTFVQARTTHGELGYNLWGEADPSQEAKDTLLRFAAVFDLAYRRFVDLEEAEHQAREAQINLAVEKVRARAMAMHGSEEMAEVAETLRDQLQELGVEGVSSSTVYTEQGDGKYRIWDMADIQGVEDSEVTLDFTFHPDDAKGDLYFRDILDSVGYSSFHYQGQRLQGISDWLRDYDPVSSDTMDRLIKDEELTDLWISSYPVQRGFLSVDTVVPSSEELAVILPRMASAFDLAYRRFEDLQEAEAATREAQIDAALERVRGQAMAMQKPEDISEVSIRMFDELEGLGIVSLRSGISIPGEGERYIFHAATKDEEGATTLVLGDESVDVHPIIRRAYEGWKSQESFQRTVLEGKDLVAYYHAVFDTMPLPDWKERMQRGEEATESFATFPFQDGWLYTFVRHEIDSAELDLYQRFARVFGLAYQRYHDLTQAEKDYQALLTEKARTEKALSDLQATQKQLVEQEKLASLGSLTAGIAHEIKNPLNFVNNFAEVSTELMEELADAVTSGDIEEVKALLEDLRDNAEQITKHGKRADSIVRSMMQHARGGASDQEMIIVNDFLEEYGNLAWHGMRARDHGFSAELLRDFDPEAGSIKVMPQELGRVVLNLLNNAFDAVKTMEAGEVTMRSARTEEGLAISVSDNGPGIPEDIRQKIFEPFFTTKATGEGTGLGLSLSYDIITKGHGGTMTVGTSKEGGALFTLSLPTS